MIPTGALETLRNETLGHTVPWLPGAADTYAQVASWAVWADETADSTAWSRDQSVLATEVLAPVARARVVFVALNMGTNPAVATDSDWSNFHSGRSDYKLARAIAAADPSREVLWGGYMTDLFKGLPTPTAADLTQYLDGLSPGDLDRTVAAMAGLLERELKVLGDARPLVVCIGRTAQEWIARTLPGLDTVGITHYAAALGNEEYAGELQAVALRADRRPR